MILISAFAVILIGLFDSYQTRIIASIFIMGLLPLFCDRKYRFISSLIILSFVLVSYPLERNYFDSGRVIEIRDRYYLLSAGFDKVVLYTADELSLDDKVVIKQEVKAINYYDNFNLSTYLDYCRANRIIGSVSKDRIESVESSFSFRRIIYEKCLNGSGSWVLQLLFKNSMEIESDRKFFITQSSLHISFFVSFLKNILALFFYEKKADRIVLILIFFLGLFFNFPYGYVRILTGLFLLCFIADRRKRLAYELLIMAFYKPYFIKSIPFLIPMGIRIINCFLKEKKSVFITLYVMIVQLSFYGQIDLLSIISFSFFKKIFGLVYLAALLVCFLPVSLNLDSALINFFAIIDSMPQISLTGTFNAVLLTIILALAFRYLETLKNKYLAGLFLVLLVNNNLQLFSPVYTVTFLDQTTPNMIQRISGIFERKPLISKEI
ncbi:MAG TPA: hypothetical protein PLI19_03865 [Erysipelotrichaceae bacterium]|nr:hypothetical protein [Erysipelotrichaceae bacterium]HQB32451.1 hypothetical protein [Erysipelotrichaceae bacterium]